jgi:hypothetical protein
MVFVSQDGAGEAALFCAAGEAAANTIADRIRKHLMSLDDSTSRPEEEAARHGSRVRSDEIVSIFEIHALAGPTLGECALSPVLRQVRQAGPTYANIDLTICVSSATWSE